MRGGLKETQNNQAKGSYRKAGWPAGSTQMPDSALWWLRLYLQPERVEFTEGRGQHDPMSENRDAAPTPHWLTAEAMPRVSAGQPFPELILE